MDNNKYTITFDKASAPLIVKAFGFKISRTGWLKKGKDLVGDCFYNGPIHIDDLGGFIKIHGEIGVFKNDICSLERYVDHLQRQENNAI